MCKSDKSLTELFIRNTKEACTCARDGCDVQCMSDCLTFNHWADQSTTPKIYHIQFNYRSSLKRYFYRLKRVINEQYAAWCLFHIDVLRWSNISAFKGKEQCSRIVNIQIKSVYKCDGTGIFWRWKMKCSFQQSKEINIVLSATGRSMTNKLRFGVMNILIRI